MKLAGSCNRQGQKETLLRNKQKGKGGERKQNKQQSRGILACIKGLADMATEAVPPAAVAQVLGDKSSD